MAVPFIDLSRLPEALHEGVREAVLRVLDHRRFILGEEVAAFEAKASRYLGGPEAIGTSSGTDALLVALMALGVRPGDRVATTPFSFFATAGTIARLGARPVLVDIEPETYGIDPERLLELDPPTVRGIVPVHLFGHVADLDPVRAWAGSERFILEDAAQALGARDERGRPPGAAGDATAFSFFPTKNLGALGDAGMVTTRDRDLAARIRRLRAHGQSSAYVHEEIGGNFRLDALQAAALAVGLDHLDALTEARRRNARLLTAALGAAGALDGPIVPPRLHEGHGVHQYVVRVRDGRRDAVLEGLKARGVGAMVYYPRPFHLQPCFADLGYREGELPEAERAAREVLALPVFPGLTEAEIEEIAAAVATAVA